MKSYAKSSYAILFVLLGLFSALYVLDLSSKVPVAGFTDGNWEKGVFRHGAAGLLLDRSPFAESITVGSKLDIDNAGERAVLKIVGTSGPYWEVWLDGAPFDLAVAPQSFRVVGNFASLPKFLLVFAILLVTTSLFTIATSVFLQQRGILADLPGKLSFGASYFVGISFFLFVWRALSLATGSAAAGFYICLAIPTIFLAYSLIKRKNTSLNFSDIFKQNGFLYLCIFILSVYFLFFWVSPLPAALNFTDPSLPLGAFESGRYGNIASYILEADQIPVLKQNYGQSILSAAPGFLSYHAPRISLLFWLAISAAALLLMIIGYAEHLKLGRGATIILAVVVLFGCPRLTLTPVQLTDNHSTPLLYNAYADTLLSLGIFFVGFILATGTPVKKNGVVYAAIFFLMGVLWSLCGFQFIPTFLLFAVWLFLARRKEGFERASIPVLGALSLLLGVAVTLPFGGMLALQGFLSDAAIPGVYPAPNAGLADLDFVFRSTHIWFPDPYHWTYVGGGSGVRLADLTWHSVAQTYQSIAILEAIFFENVRSMFFILYGLLYCAFSGRITKINHMLGLVICSIAIGCFFSYILVVGQLAKELLRFMNPAYFFGMLLFGISVAKQWSVAKRGGKFWPGLAFTYSVTGPIVAIVLQIAGSFHNLSLAQKVNIMMSVPNSTTAEK